MKIIFLSFILIFCNLAYPQKNNKEDVVWSKTKKLSWRDFRYVDNDSTLIGEKAIIAPQFITEASGIDTLSGSVYVILNSELSMTVDTTSSDLLEHEQLHFDIAEIFARKMRKEFANLSKKGCSNFESFWQIEDSINNEYILFQNQYDSETGHSVLRTKQVLWNKKVEVMLDNLNEYELRNETETLVPAGATPHIGISFFC